LREFCSAALHDEGRALFPRECPPLAKSSND